VAPDAKGVVCRGGCRVHGCTDVTLISPEGHMETDAARERLLQERRRLETSARERLVELDVGESERSSIGDLSGLDQHQADVGTEAFERERELSVLEGLDDQLREIDAALERVEAGTFGRCERCGREIDDERLEALPMARRCRDHAQEG